MDRYPKPYQPGPAPRKTHHSRKDIISTIAIILAAPVLAIFLTIFVFQSYQVDGPSMETTLQSNDRLLVLKTAKTWSKITRKPYIPKRYDIIVFNHIGEFDSGESEKKQLIKRVIGLPGDRVVIKNGQIIIYNQAHPEGYLVDRAGPETAVIKATEGNIDQTVPANEIFVLGDNRGSSLDSRAFGTVPASDVIGRLSIRFYPFGHTKTF